DALPGLMGMAHFYELESRFPWTAVTRDVAKAQGFFHWELDFTQVFVRGGLDLQVGNPPWVRPRWQEAAALAELEPWFMLVEKPSAEDWRLRKQELLGQADRDYYLRELASNIGLTTTLGAQTAYPLLVGTQPDLYRAFMCQVWSHAGRSGISG